MNAPRTATQLVELGTIRLDGDTQSRAQTDPATVAEYAELYRQGVGLPAVVLFFDGEDYWCADGHHRVEAAILAELEEIDAFVRDGSCEDAALHSCGANLDHGLKRSPEDKRSAARRCMKLRPQWSDRKVAEHCGIDHKTVASERARAGGEIPQVQEREGRDGKLYSSKPAAPAPAPLKASNLATEAFLSEPMDPPVSAPSSTDVPTPAEVSPELRQLRSRLEAKGHDARTVDNLVRLFALLAEHPGGPTHAADARVALGLVATAGFSTTDWSLLLEAGEQSGLVRLERTSHGRVLHLGPLARSSAPRASSAPTATTTPEVALDLDDPGAQGAMAALEQDPDTDEDGEDDDCDDTEDELAEDGGDPKADARVLEQAMQGVESGRYKKRGELVLGVEVREAMAFLLGLEQLPRERYQAAEAAAAELGLVRLDGPWIARTIETGPQPAGQGREVLPNAAPTAPARRTLDRALVTLHHGDVAELLGDMIAGMMVADLVIVDAPWIYRQRHGASGAEDHYQGLSVADIAAHVRLAHQVARRLAFWVTGPLLGEWMGEQTPWGAPVTAGAWLKSDEGDSGHYGQGYHWAGCSELVLLYTGEGAHTDRAVPLRNAWHEPPGQHSRKPVGWQKQWIERWVRPGEIVLDLYAGTGSVAEATLRAGGSRRYVGAEIDATRHAGALENIERLCVSGVSRG